MKEQILSFLPPEYPWKDRLFVFPELDSTNNRLKVLASQGAPHGTVLIADRQTVLHNDVTGQTIVIDKSTLLGRKPSMDVPQGAKAVRIVDPTRTTSRNHAAISIDTDGALWIEDYGSLNGTYIITNGQETQVTKGTPLKLSAPATVRIGDQFFQFTEKQA